MQPDTGPVFSRIPPNDIGTKQLANSWLCAEVPSLRESPSCSHGGLSLCAQRQIAVYFHLISWQF